jgi:hypothetical protein
MYLNYARKALIQCKSADHLLHKTFPLIKDPKVLVGVLDNLACSLELAMSAILAFEKKEGIIEAYPNNFNGKFSMFQRHTVPRRGIAPIHQETLIRLRALLDLHKKSTVEFQRGNKLVLCTSRYEMETLTKEDMSDYIKTTREFLRIMDKIIN